MKKNLEIRDVKSSEVKDIIAFHNATHGDNRRPEHWAWEYRGNYPESYVFGIIKDKEKDRLVGTQGMIPIYINIGGDRYFSGKSENSLLDPNYRGGTLFQDLYEYTVNKCKEKKMCCIWGYTSAGRVWRKKLKFEVYAESLGEAKIILNFGATIFDSIQSKIKNVLKAIRNKQTTVGKIIEGIFHALSGKLKQTPKSKSESISKNKTLTNKEDSLKGQFKIVQKLRSYQDLNSLYKRLRKTYPNLIHIDQDKKYVQWRIFDNPVVKYDTDFVYEGNILRAYCYINTTKRRCGYISDLTFETPDAGDFLIENLISKLRSKKIAYVTFFGNMDNPLIDSVFELLKTYGARIQISNQFFVLRNLSYNDKTVLFDIKNWYLNALWSEGYD